jgi:phosphoserine phosphatase RsbU/P
MPETTPCYLLELTSEGLIRYANDLLLTDLEYTSEEVIGALKFDRLLTPGSRIFYQMHFYPTIKLQGTADELFLSLKSRSGREVPVLLNAIAQSVDGLKVIRMAGIAISKRNTFEKALIRAKQAAEKALLENELLLDLKSNLERNTKMLEYQLRQEKRVNEEQKQVGKFLAHDLQEHLRKISLSANRIIDKFEGEARQYARKIIDQNENNRRLLNAIHEYQGLELHPSQLVEVDLISTITKVLHATDSEIKTDLSGLSPVNLLANPKYLERLFEELVDNSLKFRVPTSALQLRLSSEIIKRNHFEHQPDYYEYKEYVLIRYEDNGMGFEQKYAEKTFVLLEKLEPNIGFGLGLAFAKKIVQLHQGDIKAISEPDKGTVFIITLPLR